MNNDIKALIQAELAQARAKHAQPINSNHEGYAVLPEEIEEAQDPIFSISQTLSRLWEGTKENDAPDAFLSRLLHIKQDSISAIQELIQVAAMCERWAQDVHGKGLDDGEDR